MSFADRPAAAWPYTAAWVLGGFGLLAIAVGYAIVDFDPFGGFLLLAGLAATLPGFTAAARYQLITRRTRPADRFHGPSPLILFVLQVAALNVITVVAYLLGEPKPETTSGFMFAAVVLLGGYVGVVWLFVIRPNALTWREILRAGPLSGGKVATDIAIGAVTMLFGAIAAGILGTLVSDLLGGTQAPNVVPTPTTGPDLALTLVGAALLVPIGEELFFRGYAVTAWLHDLGERSALIRGALFFAFVHIFNILVAPGDALDGLKQAILVVVVLTPVGLVLAWLYLRRGLIASIAGHASYNLLLITLSSIALHGTPPGFGR